MATASSVTGRLVSVPCWHCGAAVIVNDPGVNPGYVLYCGDACARARQVARRLESARAFEEYLDG